MVGEDDAQVVVGGVLPEAGFVDFWLIDKDAAWCGAAGVGEECVATVCVHEEEAVRAPVGAAQSLIALCGRVSWEIFDRQRC